MENTKTYFVICLKNKGYEASLEPRKIYESIPDSTAAKHQQIRIIDESGEDYLYPTKLFIELKVPHSLQQAISKAA